MKIISNNRLIARNKRIGSFSLIASLVVLGVGMVLTFQNDVNLLTYAMVCLIIGFILSQVSIYYGSRFGRSPRPDEMISQSLKGLENSFTLYHYSTSVAHLLVGPAGIWVIIPFHVRGVISYDEKRKRWKQKGGNFLLNLYGAESLGRPDIDAEVLVRDAQKFLQARLGGNELPPVHAVLVFTNPKAKLDLTEPPIPALPISK